MKKQFEYKTDKMKKFFSGTLTFLSMLVLLFLTLTVSAHNQSPSSNKPATPQTVFTNPAAITINDAAPATPYPSNITVSGISTVGTVKVTLNGFNHTFPDDVDILLVSPSGAKMIVWSDAGGSTAATGSTVTLDDAAATALPDTGGIPSGTYKPANYGTVQDPFAAPAPAGPYTTPAPGGTDTLTSVFGGTVGNGVWSLYVVDDLGGDSGSFTGGWSLDITSGATGCTTAKRPLDFDGDGKTDLTVVRNTGGGPSGLITWFISNSGGSPASTATPFGIASDSFKVPADYDGDGKTDIAVWRAGAQAYFYILQSQTNTLRSDPFGQTGDDPSVVGDYDGDGKADPAVYRAGATAGAQSFWFYRASTGAQTGQIVYNQWGQNGDFPAPGDFDGDNKYDFTVQRNAGGGAAIFYSKQTTAGFVNTRFGTPTDVIVPGYYDNDCKADLAVVRGSGGTINWYILNSTNGATQYYSFGASATDFPTQGDYDGDGVTDISVWRPNADPSLTYFFYRKSTDGSLVTQHWGQNGDYPVANFNSH